MGILIVLAIASMCAWAIISMTRLLIRAKQRKLWLAASLLAGVGLALGWFLANLEYHAGSNMRIVGIPMPLVFFHFEDGQWVDFPLPSYVMWPGFITNITTGIAVCLLPLRLCVKTGL